MLIPQPGPQLQPAPSAQQYPVLLLNEEQITYLLQRPALRQVNQRLVSGGDSIAAYGRVMRRGRVAAAAFAVLVAGAAAVAWAPRPALAFSWIRPSAQPTVATGASFSLAVASLRSADSAAAAAGRLEAAGIATFTRGVANKPGYQVMAGPYVSLDEAERMQRRLAAAGFGGSSLFVDESLRNAPRNQTTASGSGSNPGIVLVGAPGRLSLAFEMRSEPRQVNARRVDDSTLAVDIGPIDAAMPSQEWSAPAGVHLLRAITIEEVVGTGSARHARATLTVPAFARVNTRVEGRRVYVDLTWPAESMTAPAARGTSLVGLTEEEAPVSRAERAPARLAEASRTTESPEPAPAAQPARAVAAAAKERAAVVDAPKAESLAPIVAKFDRVLPFVQSAAKSPQVDVLLALAPTLREVDASLKGMTGTADAAARGLLISATASARRAVDPGFDGDRVAESHQAAGLFEAAKALLN
jgi:hypothetical protein